MNTSNISVLTGGTMISMAVLADSLDFLLGFGLGGFIVDIPAALFFGICFSHNNVSLLHPDRALKFIGTIALEAVPFASDIPMWTYTVTSTVLNEWRSPTV